jgi:hypothetical protein
MKMRITALAIVAALGTAVLAGSAGAETVLNPDAAKEGWPAASVPTCPNGTVWHEAEYYGHDGHVRPAGCYAD